MAAFDEPDLLEEDFPVTTKRTTVMSDDREELDHQATSLQTKLAELNRAREKLEREKATVEDSRRRLGLMEEAHMDTQRDAEQMARTIEDLRDAMSKVETLEEVDTHDEQWKVLLTRNLTTIENARMELNSARLKWTLLNGESDEESGVFSAPAATGSGGMSMPRSFGQMCLWGLALTWPVLLIGAGILAVLLMKG